MTIDEILNEAESEKEKIIGDRKDIETPQLDERIELLKYIKSLEERITKLEEK